jgi:hypothetical protein
MLLASGSVSETRGSFFAAISLGLRSARLLRSRSISASFALALAARASISRATRARAASRRLMLASGSVSTSAFSAATRALAADIAASSLPARLKEDLPADALTLVPSTMISSSVTRPSAIKAARLRVSSPSSTSAWTTRKSARP